MARKILITGAEGQLGISLQRKFRDKFDIYPTDKITSESGNSLSSKNLDITERGDVETIINEINPDIIINCAAYTDVDGSERNKEQAHMVNVVGLQNLIHASYHHTCFVQISSDYVFDGDTGPYSVEDHTYPINYYGKTKLEAENLLRGSRREYLIIRTNVLYSEDLIFKANFFAWVYKSLTYNKSISVVNDQISNPTYVSHLVETIFLCIILNTKGIYHYGSDDFLSRYEFAMIIAEVFGFDKSLISPIDTKSLFKKLKSYTAERPLNSGLKVDKIERELNISTYSSEYSLKKIKTIMA